jgi:hypothetical protein
VEGLWSVIGITRKGRISAEEHCLEPFSQACLPAYGNQHLRSY